MRKTVTLWAYSQGDLETLQGALQAEFGNRMNVSQDPTPVVYRIEGQDHERRVGYTSHVTEADLQGSAVRYISKVAIDADGSSLVERMKRAAEAVSAGHKPPLANNHSVSLGKPVVQLVASQDEAEAPATPDQLLA